MAAGDVKNVYAASADQTVTNLQSLASSTTWTAGWESGTIDNTTNKYLDYLVSCKFTGNHTAPTIGQIRVYVIAMLDDSNWPDVFDGTESAETVAVGVRDGFCKLGAVLSTDTTIDCVYNVGPFSVANLFGGVCPAKFVIFVTHSMVQTLAAAGNQITIKGVYQNVAAA